MTKPKADDACEDCPLTDEGFCSEHAKQSTTVSIWLKVAGWALSVLVPLVLVGVGQMVSLSGDVRVLQARMELAQQDSARRLAAIESALVDLRAPVPR